MDDRHAHGASNALANDATGRDHCRAAAAGARLWDAAARFREGNAPETRCAVRLAGAPAHPAPQPLRVWLAERPLRPYPARAARRPPPPPPGGLPGPPPRGPPP